jgi:hypothetical protein
VLKYCQSVTQAVWPRGAIKADAAPFFQLPNVNADQVN